MPAIPQSAFPTSNQSVGSPKGVDFSSFAEGWPDGLIFFDKSVRPIFVNLAARRLLGIKRSLPAPDEITDLLDRLFDFRDRVEAALRLKHPLRLEEVPVEKRTLRFIFTPIFRPAKDSPSGLVLVVCDRTEEIKTARSREDSTAMLVHELRAPLSMVHGVSDTLLKDYAVMKKEAIEASLHLIYDSSAKMLDLVSDLLDAAKLEAGKFEIVKEDADLRSLLQERVDFFRPLAREKNLILTLDVPEVLPKLRFDQARLGRVIDNLIANAVRFTPKGQVSVTAEVGDGEVIVAVRDTGCGIAPEDLPQLFSKYKQLKQGSANVQQGTGLGLTIVKGVVAAHGGRVWVKSKVGEGSTFYFSLPL